MTSERKQTPRAGTIHRQVQSTDTARVVGSGTLDVLGTPVVIAWMEAATLEAWPVTAGDVSLGVSVEVRHLAPSRVGETVMIRAECEARHGKRATFVVTAHDEKTGRLLADGRITRAIVDEQSFLDSLSE